jgi:hypothetical protein
MIDPEGARTIDVPLLPSTTYARGTVLGLVTASGKYRNYLTGAADGSQTAALILQYDCVTDASGNTTIQGDANAITYKVVPAWWRGVFKISELVGLDAPGVLDMGARLLLTNDPVPATSLGYIILP